MQFEEGSFAEPSITNGEPQQQHLSVAPKELTGIAFVKLPRL